jgi:Holliday junction resolvasome RuvABC endonuclease subunit
MPYIMGLDVSIKKTGYCILDTEAPYSSFIERGRLYTYKEEGIMIQRLLQQQDQIKKKIEEFSIGFISMEAPYFGGGESEYLYALNQFLHQVFLEKEVFLICFPPQQLKSIALPDKKVTAESVGKAHMILAAQKYYDLEGKVITDDEADALNVGRIGKFFYNWRNALTIKDSDLEPKMLTAFAEKKTLKSGPRKGFTEYTGLIYRENDLFFDFKKIKQRRAECLQKELEDGRSKKTNSKRQDSR